MRADIEKKLGSCKYPHICICDTKNSIETTRENLFFIYDEKGANSESPVRIVSQNDNYQLTVKNLANHEILLVKTDNCLYDDSVQKCDCVLLSTDKIFFIEIKESSSGARGKRRKDAKDQIGYTITLFKNSGINFIDYFVLAIICFKNNEPRIINSASNTAKAEFFSSFGIRLEEKNVIEF